MKYKLGELCTVITDGSHNPPKGISKSEYLMLSSKNVQDDCITFEEPRYLSSVEYEQENKRTAITAGDVLLTIVGTVGRCAVVPENCGYLTLQRSVAVLKPRNDICKSRYLMYALISKRALFEAEARGVAQKGIYLKQLSQIEIPVLSSQKQEEIISLLDKAQSIISASRQQITELDNLIKARFVEMFGDVSDEDKVTMADICKIITDGTHQPPKFAQTGIPFLFVSNIVTNEIRYDAEKFISEETYTELIKRTPIEIGDVLLSTVGSYGHPAVVKTEKPFCFQRHIAYLKPKKEIVNSEYLRGAILSDDVQRQIDERVKGIAQKTLNLSEIRKLRIPLPSKRQQEQFAMFVEQVDKSKVVVQKALDEAQTLFNSLMQEYFG